MHMRELSRGARIWLPPVAMMALIFAFSAMPAGDEDHGSLYVISRKAAHVTEYALLLALWWRALATRMGNGRALALAFLISLLYAVTDEVHQTFVSGRSGRPLDVGIDMAGALGAAALIVRGRSRRKAAA
jgi:VanZ family protein